MLVFNELPKIFVNSVPKSGTNLLIQILEGIPGVDYRSAFYYWPDREQVLNVKNGEITGGHIQYDRNLSNRLDQQGIKKVLIYRDLRDVIVSHLYFIKGKYHDPIFSPLFQKDVTDHKDQLMVLIRGGEVSTEHGVVYCPEFCVGYPLIYQWKDDSSVCSIRYEDLIRDHRSQKQTIHKLIHFLFPNLQDRLTIKRLSRSMMKNINPEKSWTFRAGKAGGWREEFTEAHKRAFKEMAGDFLIQLGYEKDQNW